MYLDRKCLEIDIISSIILQKTYGINYKDIFLVFSNKFKHIAKYLLPTSNCNYVFENTIGWLLREI